MREMLRISLANAGVPALLLCAILSACGDDGAGGGMFEDAAGDGSGADVGESTDAGADSDVGGTDASTSDAAGDTPSDTADPEDTGSDVFDGDAGNDTVGDATLDAVADVEPECVGAAGPIVINEAQVRGDEWVELYNRGECPVALGGWELTDDPVESGLGLVFDAGVWIAGGEYLVVDSEEVVEGGFAFGLTSDGELLRLLDLASLEVDRFEFGVVPEGAAVGRLPDGEGEVRRTGATRGLANVEWVDPSDAIFDPSRILQVDLTLDSFDIASLSVDPRVYVSIGARIADADGATLLDHQIAGRIKGRYGSLRSLDQKAAFKLDLNDVVTTGTLFGVRKLTLNNMVQDSSTIHEWTAYRLFREMGVPAPRVGYAWVTVNGAAYGLYAIIETPDDTLIERNFITTQHLYEGAYGTDLFPAALPDFDVDEGNPAAREDLENMILIAESYPLDEMWERFRPFVVEDDVIMAMAVETFIGHWDGYAPTRNNYYFHFDNDSRLTLMPWGADQTFDWPWNPYEGQGILLNACLANVGCRLDYNRALLAIADHVETSSIVADVAALAASLRPVFEADPRREASMGDFDGRVQQTLDFLTWRPAGVRAAAECELDPSLDRDDDGWTCLEDCDDLSDVTYPGAEEVCGDGLDQDCSGAADQPDACPDCVEIVARDGNPYAVCPFGRTYAEARALCRDLDGRLPIASSSTMNQRYAVIAADYLGNSTWLGLDDLESEGRFMWNGGILASYTNWAAGEPNDWAGNEDCAHFIAYSDQWNDIDCNAGMATLCVLDD